MTGYLSAALLAALVAALVLVLAARQLAEVASLIGGLL